MESGRRKKRGKSNEVVRGFGFRHSSRAWRLLVSSLATFALSFSSLSLSLPPFLSPLPTPRAPSLFAADRGPTAALSPVARGRKKKGVGKREKKERMLSLFEGNHRDVALKGAPTPLPPPPGPPLQGSEEAAAAAGDRLRAPEGRRAAVTPRRGCGRRERRRRGERRPHPGFTGRPKADAVRGSRASEGRGGLRCGAQQRSEEAWSREKRGAQRGRGKKTEKRKGRKK